VVAEKDVKRVSKTVTHVLPLIYRSSLTARMLLREEVHETVVWRSLSQSKGLPQGVRPYLKA